MAMHEWLSKYPQVEALLQQDDDLLEGASEEEQSLADAQASAPGVRDTLDWPSTVVFCEGRLVFGGSVDSPQALWGSPDGDA